MAALIGRNKEIKQFKSFIKADRAEFIVVLGRRRVGKTFLIREAFNNTFTFQMTGLANATLNQQLINFNTSLLKVNKKPTPLAKTWLEAFQQLIQLLEKSKDKKKIVFFDELPWLDTPKSYFLSAFEHFWNHWGSAQKDLLLIACGSATSWMINKLINNKGGLHNRITQKMALQPFTLAETAQFLQAKNINWNRYQMIEAYMAMGGIPYYLDALKPEYSATQNIDLLFFATDGLLKNEFENLYPSLFKHAENHIAVTAALSKKAIGLTREEVIKLSGLPNGGGTTKVLEELQASGFVRKYQPFDKKSKDSLYQLSDFYTLFYYRFIKDNKNAIENYWVNILDSPVQRTWAGYAFEQLCMQHLTQIKKELGISGIQSTESSWRGNGAQVDLLIDRKDQVINICEMKFSINPFMIDKKYAASLRNKIGIFKSETQTKKAVFLTMVTTYGINQNEHSTGLVNNDLTMDCLFE